MSEVVSKIVPIILLISIGRILNFKKVFKQESIDEIKKFLINFVLPSVLFITFFNMELGKEYYMISATVFILLNIFFIIGFLLNKIERISHPILPFTVTACTIAFLGLPLFASVFGEENLNKLAIIAIGHEFFIWLILYPYLSIKLGNKKTSLNNILELFKAPTMISIIIGVILNLSGFTAVIQGNQLLKGIYITIEYLSRISTPFILLIIGYGLKVNKKYLKQSTIIIAIRLIVILGIGYGTKHFILNGIMGQDKMFDYAYFTFLILPPPLSLPLLIGLNSTVENEELANNTVVLNTIISITVYIIFLLFI